ncbi:MAG: hypothetical protein U5J83_06180 [Bryobacterales bacterium]|nr:hypothetical protein [Bryobacterales bacterium]
MKRSENVWTLKVRKRRGFDLPCLEMSPDPLRIVKGQDRASRTIRFVAPKTNPVPVELHLENSPLDFLFGDAEQDTDAIRLKPGEEATFVLKARLGLVQRKNLKNRFTNADSPYSLVLKFDHPGLADGGHGSHMDMHVEC